MYKRQLPTRMLLGDNSDATTFDCMLPALNNPETHKMCIRDSPMHRPMLMYNAMRKLLQNYTIKGFIWYQGESNVGRHETYAERLADICLLYTSRCV